MPEITTPTPFCEIYRKHFLILSLMSNIGSHQGPAAALFTASSSNTPSHSSPESFEAADDEPNPHYSPSWQAHHPSTPSTSASRPPPPLQKRRRVTRACDECRKKKIKCDGKQPCTHCTVYSYGRFIGLVLVESSLMLRRLYLRPTLES